MEVLILVGITQLLNVYCRSGPLLSALSYYLSVGLYKHIVNLQMWLQANRRHQFKKIFCSELTYSKAACHIILGQALFDEEENDGKKS